MTTIKDVAALSGVSISTVSIVLNSKIEDKRVSPQTYKKVTEAINTLGYHPNMAARRLRNLDDNKPTIALFWPSDYRSSYLARILAGIQSEIKKINFNCDLVIHTYENNNLNAESILLSKNKYSAAIIGGPSYEDMNYLENISPQIPIVLFNRTSSKYFTVCNNNDDSAFKAAKLFLAKGHKSVAIITIENPFLAMDIRMKSFINACKKINLEVEATFILKSDDSFEGGVLAAKRLLNFDNRPKAVFCASDFLALGAAHLFNKEGIQIPNDLEIISIGMLGSDSTEYSTPPITVVSLPTEEMAADCLSILYNALNKNIIEPTHLVHESKLLIRDSCRP